MAKDPNEDFKRYLKDCSANLAAVIKNNFDSRVNVNNAKPRIFALFEDKAQLAGMTLQQYNESPQYAALRREIIVDHLKQIIADMKKIEVQGKDAEKKLDDLAKQSKFVAMFQKERLAKGKTVAQYSNSNELQAYLQKIKTT